MASAAMPRALSSFAGAQNLILPAALVGSVLVILVPMPTAVMDVLLASNISRRGASSC